MADVAPYQPPKIDLAGARQAGYSDQEIANALAKKTGFDVAHARDAGYNDTEIISHILSPQGNVQKAPKVGTPNAPEDPGVLDSIWIGGGHATDKIIDGLAQAWLGVTGAGDSTKQALKDRVQEDARLYQPVQEAHPIATAVGEALPSMAVPIGGGAGALSTIGRLALQGAVVPALQYGSVGERAKGAGLGAAGSVIGGTVLPAIGRAGAAGVRSLANAVSPEISPEVAALAQRAADLGIPVTRAQLSDSTFLKTLASQVEKIPFTGGTATRNLQQDAFNRAVSRTIGEDTPVLNQEVYNAAKTRIGNEFERLSSQNALQVTPALMADVNRVISNADRFGTGDAARAVRNLASDLRDHLDTGSMTIPGEAYQALDSQMSKLMKSGDPTSVFIGGLRDAVRTGMDHSISPADQAAWMTARGQYRNLKAIRDIVGKAGVDGDISPAQLMGRMNSSNASKEAMAMGERGDLGDIARIGRQFVQDRVPNSGTAQRLVAAGLAGGGSSIVGVAPMATMAATALTTGRVLNRALNSPGSGARALAASTARGTAAAPTTLADLLRPATEEVQKAGVWTGQTLANLANR